jgi:pimeloyl-ACP methyl ester carboxylesterase
MLTAKVRPARLHVEEYGAGPAVVLGHGLGGSARNFRPQARALEDRFRIVLFDARGHARSEAPPESGAYEPAAFLTDLDRVIARTGRNPVVAGGLSMGAGIALGYALEKSEALSALVLAAPPRGGSEQRAWAIDFAEAIDKRGVEAAGAEFVWGARSRFDPAGASFIRQGFLEHKPHALSAILRRLIARLPSIADLAPRLRLLEVPTLVIVGSLDTASREAAQALADLLPNAQLERIEGAGHVVNLAAPAAFDQALRRFLAGLSAGA